MKKTSLILICVIMLFTSEKNAKAKVRLHGLFTDNMVIQRDVDVPVWGTAAPGEEITIKLSKQELKATADKDGKWKVVFKPLKAGGPYKLFAKGSNTIILKNVISGDVWLCSGQSNMEMSLNLWMEQDPPDVKTASHSNIRLFTVSKKISETPMTDVSGRWYKCSPDTAQWFSAVGYYFGRELHQNLGVPIGLINGSWGGTPAESWVSRKKLLSHEGLKYYIEQLDSVVEDPDEAEKKYRKQLKPGKRKISTTIPAIKALTWDGQNRISMTVNGKTWNYRLYGKRQDWLLMVLSGSVQQWISLNHGQERKSY